MHLSSTSYKYSVGYRTTWTFFRKAAPKKSLERAIAFQKCLGSNSIHFACWPSLNKSAAISKKSAVFLSSMGSRQQNQSVVDGPVEESIRKKLLKACAPVTHLTIVNESHRHNVYVSIFFAIWF